MFLQLSLIIFIYEQIMKYTGKSSNSNIKRSLFKKLKWSTNFFLFKKEILPEHVAIIKQFHTNLMANRGSYIVRVNNRTYDPKKIAFGVNNVSVSMATHMADIFYLPKSKLSHFHFLSDLFHRNKIFLGKYFRALVNKTA